MQISVPEIIVRLLVAVLFCGAVGLQRALTGKSAGMRTHILVGVGAAIFTLVSGYAFGKAGTASSDRIAAQIVSGIGFIGGGAILKEHGSIKGLTTAAGLWTAAALGMAAGAGLYVLGATGAVIILITLVALRRVELHFPRRAYESWSIIMTLPDGVALDDVRAIIKPHCHRIALVSFAQGAETRLVLSADVQRHTDVIALGKLLRDAGANAVEWHAAGDLDADTA